MGNTVPANIKTIATNNNELMDSYITLINSGKFTIAKTLIDRARPPLSTFMKLVYYCHTDNPSRDEATAIGLLIEHAATSHLADFIEYSNMIKGFDRMLILLAESSAMKFPYETYKELIERQIFLSPELQRHFVKLSHEQLLGDEDLLLAQRLYKDLM